MDIKRLRVGTKVKLLRGDAISNYYKEGQIGTLVAGTCFHSGDGPADRGGDYWFLGQPPTEEGRKANEKGVCFGAPDFKVLKY